MKTLNTRLKAINKKCEEEIMLKLNRFYDDLYNNTSEPYIPSPQVIEALWFDLISKKEQEFIQEIELILNKPNINLRMEDTCNIKKTINDVFADSKYIKRLREFYNRIDKESISNKKDTDSIISKLDLINSAYQEGISKMLHKARKHVHGELDNYCRNKSKNFGMLEYWKKYSTLSPLRAISTIFLLYCTSLLIAWIIKGETFQKFLEQFGWSVGS